MIITFNTLMCIKITEHWDLANGCFTFENH